MNQDNSNEELVEKIKDYKKWYELYLSCIDAAEELKEKESELYAQRFENIQTQYESILLGFEHTESMLNEYINQAEAKGQILSKEYYNALISNEENRIAQLKKEQYALIRARDEAVASGTIAKYSEEWYGMCQEIDGVTQALEESTTKIIEFNNAIRDIEWQVFDLIQERISDVTAESDFFIELMSNKKLFDDKGKLTDQGLATMGLHAQNYNTHMYQSDNYGEEISKLDSQIAQDPYNDILVQKRRELIELQRESILAAEGEKQAIKDLVEEGFNAELDSLQEIIDKKNEALESEKDLYEYQKRVKEQTEEVASLRKQISAYSGDESEEAKAKIQELKVSLEEAEANLEETEYDKYIADQQKLLDSLYLEYELILNTRLDNVDALLESIITEINMGSSATSMLLSTLLGAEGSTTMALSNALGTASTSNAEAIKATLTAEANNVGTKLSTAMRNIWSTGDGNAKSVLTMYGEDFRNKSTTIRDTLNNIKVSVNSLVTAANKEAVQKVQANKTQTSAVANPTTNTPAPKPVTQPTKPSTSGGDGKPKVGDKVKFVSGKYYYDSQGTTPLGSYKQGQQVYITKINTASWATHPIHISQGNKLGNGDLGWLKLNQISGYAKGKKRIPNSEYAWTQENGQEYIVRPSDGAILTPIAKGDSVLNATATGNIWNMANSPADFIRDNLKLDSSNIPNNANVQNNYTQYLDKVIFSLPNVKNYDDILSAMQKDPNFERLLLSMTINKLAGKSNLAKNKSIR